MALLLSPPSTPSMKIVEETILSISPTPNRHLPLTFFDIPWLLFPPNQPLFFFQLPNKNSTTQPYSENHLESTNIINCFELFFISTILPTLKSSLTSALELFFPFTATLAPSQTNPEQLFFINTDDETSSSIKLTVAKCCDNYDHSYDQYHMRDADIFQNLVPHLPPIKSSSSYPTSLLSIQITYFPSPHVLAIGFAYYPVVCDQRTFCNFVQTWACLSKFGNGVPQITPNMDRSVILHHYNNTRLQPFLMKQWAQTLHAGQLLTSTSMKPNHDEVLATFVMKPTDIKNGKQWIEAQCEKLNKAYPVILSPYVVTCAFAWYCFTRAQHKDHDALSSTGPVYFGFIAGGITRLPYRVPVNYFGNCVGFGRAVARREELVKGDGILVAADAIGLAIKTLDNDLLGGAKTWIPDWESLIASEEDMNVVGSPKVNLYETDFGWGKPTKIEEISIDARKGTVSLIESKDMKGGIEIGLALSNSQMNTFSKLFAQGLHHFSTGSSF